MPADHCKTVTESVPKWRARKPRWHDVRHATVAVVDVTCDVYFWSISFPNKNKNNNGRWPSDYCRYTSPPFSLGPKADQFSREPPPPYNNNYYYDGATTASLLPGQCFSFRVVFAERSAATDGSSRRSRSARPAFPDKLPSRHRDRETTRPSVAGRLL